jgi:hypothetical protein
LIGLARPNEALATLEEALDKIWPYFERFPPVFQQDTQLMLDLVT